MLEVGESLEMKDWIYDETKHVGVDYSQESNASVYDEQMESFRDYEKEINVFVEKAGISDSQSLTAIDVGCGTGAFSIHAAPFFKKIYAVDVSEKMLGIVKSKALAKGINNIVYCKSGFLHYQPDEKVDLVFSKWAFHHLPDYWKQAALLNINKMLKNDGMFFLSDVVFRFDPEYENNTELLLEQLSAKFRKDFVEETKGHIRDEFSTFDWIIQGLLERAGFHVEKTNTENWLESEFFCRKIKSFAEGDC